MKRVLLLTVGVSALALDGRYADSGVFAVPWQIGKPRLTPVGNQGMGITASALKTIGSMFQTMR
jgi:hypothetical protein